MESMFSKLKSTVTKVTADVTSAVSVVLGNPVTREYEITGHAASGGPNLAWKIYHGFKKSTKQDVAVFVFEKKQLERFGRLDREPVLEQMRRGAQQLTRLRHPRLLTVQHPLEESRDCLAFCTEPVFASLANVLGKYDNLPSPVPADICEHELYNVETKYGLLQLAEGLSFLHNSVRMIHGNLTPENVILNKNGAWKIMGFDFYITASSNDDNEVCDSFLHTVPCILDPLKYLGRRGMMHTFRVSEAVFACGHPIIPCLPELSLEAMINRNVQWLQQIGHSHLPNTECLLLTLAFVSSLNGRKKSTPAFKIFTFCCLVAWNKIALNQTFSTFIYTS
uniref:Protein kinase domain-containing protein n=1 Tax=Eptatretus burgeri TaxID=7764 RepID=A0A8C4QA10_EPTBU